MKKAILVVSFGTSYLDNLDKTIGAVEQDIKNEFPLYEVRRAFTSKMIIKKLKNRDGIEIDDVTNALKRLAQDGYEEVICQPTHIMNGLEYDEMCQDINQFHDKFTIKIGRPLLSITQDYFDVVEVLSEEISFNTDENYLFMGHGTTHFANATYPALDYHFKLMGYDNVHIGTVEGFPELDVLMNELDKQSNKNVVLAPLMLVSGDHANNDMAGDEDSWKSELQDSGYKVRCIMNGLGQYKKIRKLYIKHLKEIIE